MNLIYAFAVNLTPEAVQVKQALDDPDGEVEGEDIKDSLLGDEPADVAAARSTGSRTISIQEALAAGGLDLMEDLRAQMEAGASNPLG